MGILTKGVLYLARGYCDLTLLCLFHSHQAQWLNPFYWQMQQDYEVLEVKTKKRQNQLSVCLDNGQCD